jgi:hypothetical protein
MDHPLVGLCFREQQLLGSMDPSRFGQILVPVNPEVIGGHIFFSLTVLTRQPGPIGIAVSEEKGSEGNRSRKLNQAAFSSISAAPRDSLRGFTAAKEGIRNCS